MFSKTHQGIVKNTVVLEFENGYKITLEKGVEMCMQLVMDEAQIRIATSGRYCYGKDNDLLKDGELCPECGLPKPPSE